MKKIFIIFVLLLPFITYADDNGDCINYNDEIQNLINSNDDYSIYEFLRYSYLDYYKKCGNTDNLTLLVDKYISLIDIDFDYGDYNANLKLIRALRPYLNEVQYNSFKKNVIVNNIKFDKELLLYRFLLDVYKIDVSDDIVYKYNNLLQDKVDERLLEYFNVDTNKSCEDGERYGKCTYKYINNKPLKVSGTLTVSNLYNQENTDYPNYFKASFKADNTGIDFSKLFVVPINYNLNTQIPKNYIQKGAVGEITFNVDFILDNDSIIEYVYSPFGNISSIYVKDLNINSVKNIKYYDEAFINSYKFSGIIKSFKINSKDSNISLRDMPNGKVIYKIKLDGVSNPIVYFYSGYIEPNPNYHDKAEYFLPSNYLYNYYRILRFSKSVVNDWYFVTYFPKDNSKPVFGYIHSSQLSYYYSYDSDYDYPYSIDGSRSFDLDSQYLDSLSNIDRFSYIDIFKIFHKMYDNYYNFSRVPYIKNKNLQSLVDKYVSYLLSSNFIMRNDEDGKSYDVFFVNSFLYYISDTDYYKILDKYSKDVVKFKKLFKDNRSLTCSNAVKNIISPKYASYFKFDNKRCDYIENNNLDNFNKLFYGIYDADKFFKQMILRYNIYNFNAPNHVKVNGKVIIDSMNHDISFMFNDLLLMDNVSIYPLNYSFDKSIHSNIINKGYLGKVSFDVELTLSKNTLLVHSDDIKLFVDNMHIKNAKNITYYDIDYYEPIDYLDFIISHYEVFLMNSSVPLFDYFTGKVITNIKHGGKVYFVRFNIDSLWDNILDYKFNYVLGKYYRVIYFPDGVTDGSKAISGYINSNLIRPVFN